MAYSFLGESSASELKVGVTSEDKVTTRVAYISHGDTGIHTDGVWYQLSAKLPDGLHLLRIVGSRTRMAISGMALDDIVVQDCTLSRSRSIYLL